jgi:signal transduction histidine kinase
MRSLELSQTNQLALPQRLTDAARTLAFLVASLPLGVMYLVTLPIAALAGPAALRRLLEAERALVNRLLCARIPAPPPLTPETTVGRRQVAFLAGKLPVSACAAAVCALPIALFAELLVRSVQGLAASSSYLGPWRLGAAAGLVLLLLAAPAFILSVAALGETGLLISRVSRHGLSSPAVAGVPVREVLAERLGDRTLAIAYWLPERGLFVDQRGHPVTLPEPGTGKAWTAVEHNGSRVAAIIHDAELQARPELVEAAAAGAVLALDNERLKADLRARLQELHASRRRIVAATVEARRRLERDLHDGAQQRLVSLSLDLQLLRGRIADGSTVELLDDTIAKLGEAMTELRELARGIHPPMLSDRGLAPALDALAQRSAVPVELELKLDGRLPAEVETAGYFVAAEALTNVAKYADATHARVAVTDTGGVLELEVRDDGIGGANAASGSGLRGLSDRVAALDGELIVDSPVGSGTRVTATIPSTDGRP